MKWGLNLATYGSKKKSCTAGSTPLRPAHQVSWIAGSSNSRITVSCMNLINLVSQRVCLILQFIDWTVSYQLSKKSSLISLTFRCSELVLSSWIHKSSSLPFLSRFDAHVTQFQPSLLLRDFNGQHELLSQESEPNTAVYGVKDRNRLTSLEKKSLIRKRLIPLIVSLMILGAAVAIHVLVPLPSSHNTASVGNDTLGSSMTSNTTRNSWLYSVT